MNNWMLMFSLGPVQPFIMQARKTRDLWIGSLLLSTLMEAAMADIEGEFVFPAIKTVQDVPDIPNKYVALFPSLEKARDAALLSQKNIRERWNIIQQKVWKDVIASHGDDTTSTIWQRQTNFETLFEIYWAIGERQNDMSYGAWLNETEALFAARKRLRDFKPQNEPGEKSAISGEREVLRSYQSRQDTSRDFWTRVASAYTVNDIDQEGKERLDAIDTVKRFAMQVKAIPSEMPFPSTSSIATASFVEKLLDCDLQEQAFENWRTFTRGKLTAKSQDAARDIPYLKQKAPEDKQWLLQRDGDLYFPAVFAPNSLKNNYRITDSVHVIRDGKAALKALLKQTDGLGITRPTPYYAVVQMDGDKMGLLLSETSGDEEHGQISQALSTFARTAVPELVEQQYPARLVYAGGDDVLALAPLARDMTSTNNLQPHSILALADALQARYRQIVSDAILTKKEERAQNVTASMGIAVAHHYTSLSYVLRSAREAEAAAKKRYDRNALVVTILRRSGEQTLVGCHWHYPELETDGQPVQLFSKILPLFQHDTLSPKCVYVLLEETFALVGLERAAQQGEMKRVFLRHLDLRQKSDEEKTALKGTFETIARQLVRLAEAMDASSNREQMKRKDRQKEALAVELHTNRRRYGIVEVLGWLLVLAFLARKDRELE